MRTFMEAWQDAEEGPLLMAALGEAGPGRARYVEWLRARGDERGELVWALWRLCEEPLDIAEREALIARVEGLAEVLDPRWGQLFARMAGLLNCGGGGAGEVERFAFECPRRWETLEVSERPGERWCGACAQRVYLCESAQEVELRARRGECVAVRSALAERVGRELTQHMVGRPEPMRLWAERIFGGG